MRRALIACAVVAMLCVATPGGAQDARKVVAVVDFQDLVHGWSNTTQIVTDRLISQLRDEGTLRVLPREQVEAALQSANVGSQGVLDAADAQKIGQSLGAAYVVMGEIDQFNWDYHSAYRPRGDGRAAVGDRCPQGPSAGRDRRPGARPTGGQGADHTNRRIDLGRTVVVDRVRGQLRHRADRQGDKAVGRTVREASRPVDEVDRRRGARPIGRIAPSAPMLPSRGPLRTQAAPCPLRTHAAD